MVADGACEGKDVHVNEKLSRVLDILAKSREKSKNGTRLFVISWPSLNRNVTQYLRSNLIFESFQKNSKWPKVPKKSTMKP